MKKILLVFCSALLLQGSENTGRVISPLDAAVADFDGNGKTSVAEVRLYLKLNAGLKRD